MRVAVTVVECGLMLPTRAVTGGEQDTVSRSASPGARGPAAAGRIEVVHAVG